MPDIPAIARNFARKTREDGLSAALRRSAEVVNDRMHGRRGEPAAEQPAAPASRRLSRFVDVLIVNGMPPSIPQCIRYRVLHKIEQLEAAGMSCARVDEWDLDIDMAGDARNIIFYRCPWSPELADFVRLAKSLNKRVYYDIDDLVVDTKYTDSIPTVQALSPDERELYDDGVRRYGRMLRECGSGITTTTALAKELETIVPEVFVNRNVASEEMASLSEKAILMRTAESFSAIGLESPEDHAAWEILHPEPTEQGDPAEEIVRIGYFSGTSTHNDDMEIIEHAMARVLEEHANARMMFMGLIDVPESLKQFESQIEFIPFGDWRTLPFQLARVDINLAPLVDTLFNAAKSENKWVEAALVKVPTVASRVGAFEEQIEQGVTGLLCSSEEEWYQAISQLTDSSELRHRIGSAAYRRVHRHCLTIGSGFGLAAYLRERQTPNVGIVLPGMHLSGGVLVALKHAQLLQEAGKDVMLFEQFGDYGSRWYEDGSVRLPVRTDCGYPDCECDIDLRGRLDVGVATMWRTLPYFLSRYGSVGKVKYLVQGYEPDLYPIGDKYRIAASATYGASGVEYLTISKWCQTWLRETMSVDASYVPNGIDLDLFTPRERRYPDGGVPCTGEGKIRILIEGDSAVDYKNVDEAFNIVALLPEDLFEIWYLSYNGEAKPWYRVDKAFNRIPHVEAGVLYAQCHILLKTSKFESFSYPPLEMMATGGAVVAVPNEGNAEYLVDGENCLLYPQGDLNEAVRCIYRIMEDGALRARLRAGGLQTARDRDWDRLREGVVALYG